MRVIVSIATGLALCGCPVIDGDLASQKTEIPVEDTAADIIDEDEDGFGIRSDCDDTDASVNPNSVERCDGIDNNCDGLIDGEDSIDAGTWYPDADGDGYGAAAEPVVACEAPSGLGVDGSDCDDSDPSVNPDAYEDCATAADDNCDGDTNDENAIGCIEYYYDGDGDGSGASSFHCFCEPRDGFSAPEANDCDDAEATTYSGAPEICDGLDNDCDGALLADETDDDFDGYVECTLDSSGWDGDSAVTGGEDCDDFDSTVLPGATEICDGQDNDCDGSIPNNEMDDDYDGYVECTLNGGWDGAGTKLGDDCDDTHNRTFPGAATSDSTTACMRDADNDEYGDDALSQAYTAGTDCDDGEPTLYSGASELCDGQINNCNTSSLPGDEIDDDADGYVECTIDTGGWDGVSSVIGGDDCDDSEPHDMDCDGSLTVDDCDDNDPDIYPWDRDGDGVDEGCGWSVDAGFDFTCGVTTSGSVECWGYDISGEATPPSGTFESVSGGRAHTCGVKTDSSLECWGTGGNLQAWQAAPPSGTFVSVSAGESHTCGVTTSGSVECWGHNNYGQTTPPPGTFQSVSGGYSHTCGVKTDGSVECWGAGTTNTGQYPIYGQSIPPSDTFQSVSAGENHTCGVTISGSVECWGRDNFGQVTDTPTGTFESVSVGSNHNCGVTTSGSVECWGSGTTNTGQYPYNGQSIPPSDTFQSVSAGLTHTCGVKTDGSVECWGRDNYGQVSDAP